MAMSAGFQIGKDHRVCGELLRITHASTVVNPRELPLRFVAANDMFVAMDSSAVTAVTPSPSRAAIWCGAIVGIAIPTLFTWIYFDQMSDAGPGVQRGVMAAVKILQFAFPLVWLGWILRERLTLPRPSSAGLALGAVFGIAVTMAGFVVYTAWLQHSASFIDAMKPIHAKVAAFGIDEPWKFIALGAFYAGIHSLLEEYYWRWFVFAQLRRVVPLWPAIVISALGFAAHHVLVLSPFFGWWTVPTLLLSSAVAIGGGVWAWLYARTNSLYAPWLSHAIIDAGIFLIGYWMVFQNAPR
jgi:membrane protease YdiL (CAAX protease family)